MVTNNQAGMIIRELKSELAEKDDALSDLMTNHVADAVGGAASTALTWAGAALEGAVSGALGPRDSIGPVPITAIGAGALATVALFVEEPNMREGMNALARGIGAHAVRDLTYRASLAHFHPEMEVLLEQADAAMAVAAVKK